jgi:DNA-3-methyladenine glycosylase
MSKFLPREFFMQPTVAVAQDLLGKRLYFYGKTGLITETEAYVGFDDPACHAARGKTKRNAAMFLRAGHTYVYMIYGMYSCLNVVTEEEGFPAAVLIRGVDLVIAGKKLDGPGKLCRGLGIDKSHNGVDLINNKDFSVLDSSLAVGFAATTRIGISQGQDKLWRFVLQR